MYNTKILHKQKNEGKYDYKYKKIYINMKTKMWMNIKKLNISDFLNSFYLLYRSIFNPSSFLDFCHKLALTLKHKFTSFNPLLLFFRQK